jgi:hypothetical protein
MLDPLDDATDDLLREHRHAARRRELRDGDGGMGDMGDDQPQPVASRKPRGEAERRQCVVRAGGAPPTKDGASAR